MTFENVSESSLSDLNDPIAQIRDRQYVIDTPSLIEANNEPVPEEIIRDLLSDQWIPTENAPRPRIVVVDEVIQVEFKREDALIVALENYKETPNGFRHEFVDIEIPITLQIFSNASRQRMWNIMGEARRIIYKWMLALAPYQCLYYDGFRTEVDGPGRWNGTISIRLTADMVPIMKRELSGSELPSISPEDFYAG